MKIKTLNGLLIIIILTILLILAINFIPSSIVRIIVGLPFLLFFPGYTLVMALFIKREGMDGIELAALSFGMSVAIVALIGMGLNYTPAGIRVDSVLYSVAGFVFVMSVIGTVRRIRLLNTGTVTAKFSLKFPGWEGGPLNKALSILLVISILGTIGMLGYALAVPKTGELFSEYYILGPGGKAQEYPVEFTTVNDQITGVKYNTGTIDARDKWGKVTVGIVNHEQQKVVYSIQTKIDNELVGISYGGAIVDRIGPIELRQGQRWEQEIGFAPQHVGDGQKLELLLFKDNSTVPENSVYLWINAKEAG